MDRVIEVTHMASIQAKVMKNVSGTLHLSASRQGGCSACDQNKHCALVWSPDPIEEAISIHSHPDTNCPESLQLSSLKQGDIVNLNCDEKELLHYIGLLFVPSLMMLLVCSSLLSLVYQGNVPSLSSFIVLIFSLLLGARISQFLLHKSAEKLVKTSITPLDRIS
jgi:positive regulator of sigma E activity